MITFYKTFFHKIFDLFKITKYIFVSIFQLPLYLRGKCKILFFQILWKSRCNILVTFPSHLKKLRIYWDLDKKSWIVNFFTREKTPQNNFSSQNLSKECNFFKWDGKETKLLHLLFHRIWKNILLHSWGFIDFVRVEFKVILMSLALPCMKK